MKILLATGIYPPDAGGPATYTRALARALASSGEHQIQVVAYAEADGIDEKDGYPVERIGRNRDLLMRYWNFFRAVVRRARSADVVYLQGPVSEGLPGTLGAMVAGKPTVMKVVGDYAWEMYMQSGGTELLNAFLKINHSGKIGWIARIERWMAKRATRVIVPSWYLKTVVEAWGVPTERISVIYNAIGPLPIGGSREELRRSFGIEGHRVVLTSVRAVPWKGVDFLMNLLPDLPKDIFFAVAGDGPMLETWKREAVERGLSNRIRFLGRLDRALLADWYRAADLFVLASGYEGYPHVVAEAASVGLPSFVSDQGGNPETKELLGTNLVRVLPYRDRESWMNAFRGNWLSRMEPKDAIHGFDEMVSNTVSILKSAV